MNKTVSCSGLSARRKTTDYKNYLVMLLLLLSMGACHDTTRGQERADTAGNVKADSIRKPEVTINVNKRYDENGNLIGYDSLYSTYYSSVGDTVNQDSIRQMFDTYFNTEHRAFFNTQMNSLFFSDTLAYPEFFHDDFFRKHYQVNNAYMSNMMQRMDSIKNEFYRRQRRAKEEPKKL